MKKRELLRQLNRIARDGNTTFEFVRDGSKHDVHQINNQRLEIPRHAEINERLARSLIRKAKDATK